jgi:hypothetical protein
MLGSPLLGADVTVSAPQGSPRIDFGVNRLEQSLQQTGNKLVRTGPNQAAAADIAVSVARDGLSAEDFRTTRTLNSGKMHLELAGGGENGAMYGLLDAAEQLRLTGSLGKIPQRTVRPRMGFRAIKFNLPWMSYRKGEALQLHTETVRDLNFWRSFLDMMADNRFNTLTLWNLHPYTFMIRPKNFPEASPFTDAELADWQRFYHTLFRMARDRGIDTYVVNWNTFVSPEFARAHKVAEYSEDWGAISGPGDTSELVERYLRECVTQVLDEYPELTGLGITLGERMGGTTSEQRRDWVERVYIAGMRASKHHGRLIYRAPLSADMGSGGSTSAITEKLTRESIDRADVEQPVWVELKYNWSHAHSATKLYIVHGGGVSGGYWEPMPKSLKVVWTMRNEDFFVLRWGDPDFIREAMANNSEDWVGGFVIGSECYIPAKDYVHANGPHRTWQYAFERQWLFYSLWGRLLFDPTTPDAVFEAQLSQRYGEGRGADLLQAWRIASRAPLHIASFYQGTSDGTLYSEGFASARNRELHLIGIDQLINRPTLDPSLVSIAEFVKAGGRVPAGKISPLKLADTVEREAAESMRIVAEIRNGDSISSTLDCELDDIESWAWLDRYLAEKLRGGVALATFRASGDAVEKQRAVASLERAVADWSNLARLIHSHDNAAVPNIFDRDFSWIKLIPEVEADVDTARTATGK